MKKEETSFVIKPLNIQTASLRIVGDTPLIVHAWSEKAKREMLEAQQGKKTAKKKPSKMPFDDFARALYWITDMPEVAATDPGTGDKRMIVTEEAFEQALADGAKFGFPVASLKMAANAAAYRLGWVKNQMELRGSYFLKPAHDISGFGDMAEIITPEAPVMREDMVRIGNGSADLRYRGEFRNWSMEFIMEYNASGNMTIEQILNCIDAGGFVCGIGEWRPEKDGDYGRYHLEVVNK